MTNIEGTIKEIEEIFKYIDTILIKIGDRIEEPEVYNRLIDILNKHPIVFKNRSDKLRKMLEY